MEPLRRYSLFVATGLVLAYLFLGLLPSHAIPVGVTVSTGDSMKPTLSEGPNIVVYVDQADYEEGDIVSFEAQDSSEAVLHRVVERNPTNVDAYGRDKGELRGYLTKGDNNKPIDQTCCVYNEETLHDDDIHGRAVLIIDTQRLRVLY